MKTKLWWSVAGAALFLLALPATAGQLEDGIAAREHFDGATAVKLLRPLALQGNAEAQHQLAFTYYTASNPLEALKWDLKAAQQGNVEAQYDAANQYDFGQGIARDGAEAIRWYRKAAEQGKAGAQSVLGEKYLSGGMRLKIARKPRNGCPRLQTSATLMENILLAICTDRVAVFLPTIQKP